MSRCLDSLSLNFSNLKTSSDANYHVNLCMRHVCRTTAQVIFYTDGSDSISNYGWKRGVQFSLHMSRILFLLPGCGVILASLSTDCQF